MKSGCHLKSGQCRPFEIRTCPVFGSPLKRQTDAVANVFFLWDLNRRPLERQARGPTAMQCCCSYYSDCRSNQTPLYVHYFFIFRHSHWLKIAEDYNHLRGTKLSYQSLSKKLANMKQRDRQKVMSEKNDVTNDEKMEKVSFILFDQNR